MKVAITGASGLIGTALSRSLAADGHTVLPIVRGAHSNVGISWSPSEGTIEATKLIGVDAVVHLAGEPIVGLRWTAEKKRRVLSSRVDGTSLIARTLATLQGGPRVLVSGSAVGIYGDTRHEVDEDSPPGSGFLADVCVAWEAAAAPAKQAGLRVVHPRIGLVLSETGGVLGRMLPAFRLGVGGPIGGGEQGFPWISLTDLTRAIQFAIEEDLEGPVNLVSPGLVTNAEFASALAEVLGRPAIVRIPRFAIRAAMGAMGDETLLAGQRAVPRRLTESGFAFHHAELGQALRALLG